MSIKVRFFPDGSVDIFIPKGAMPDRATLEDVTKLIENQKYALMAMDRTSDKVRSLCASFPRLYL